MSYTAPNGMKIHLVEFRVAVPEDVSAADVGEWVCFNLHNGDMLNANPLSSKDLEAVRGSIRVW